MSDCFGHYVCLRSYLSGYLSSQTNNNVQRVSAREKLTKLTKHQFNELSTDVFDELNRRQTNNSDVPFLQLRDDFHPKRNQARQKLATLPTNRFKDLYSIYPSYLRHGESDGTVSADPANDSRYNASQQQPLKQLDVQQKQPSSQFPPSYQNNSGLDAAQDHAPPTIPPPVNFGNLDNLITDLGDIVVQNPKNANYNENAAHAMEKLRAEYDTTIKSLQARNTRLEEELSNANTLILEANKNNTDSLQAINAQNTAHEVLKQQQQKLKQDYDCLQDDYANQQNIANDIRTEATNLLQEIKAVSQRNDDLIDENKRLKQSNAFDDNLGVIDQNTVASYQQAVEELLRAARSDTPTSVLVAMKAVVMACKNITEDTENFEISPENTLDFNQQDQLANYKQNLSLSLTNLMAIAKKHATSYGNTPVSLIEGAATNLTATIVDLVELLQLKPATFEGGDDSARRDTFDIDQLKLFLEKQTDQIVQAIQTLLYAMRQSQVSPTDFHATVTGITKVVDHVIEISQKTLAQPFAAVYRERSGCILGDLSIANSNLVQLGQGLEAQPSSKNLKQRVASCSYEIAKFMKELISLIE